MKLDFDFDDLLDWRHGEPEAISSGGGPTYVAPLRTCEQWQDKAESLRQLYRWLLGRPPEGFDLPLDLRIEGEEDWRGVSKRTISYMVGPDERITAYVLIPKTAGPFPAVLTIHPTNASGREMSIGNDPNAPRNTCAYGLHLAERGYVTISWDQDSTHDRQYPGLDPFDNTPFYEKYPNWSGRGRDIHDVIRAIDALEQIPEVDTSYIGSIGHSQGGGLTTDAMALDSRIKVGVNNCGDWPTRLSRNPFHRCRSEWWIGNPHLRPFAVTGKRTPIDLHERLALAAPRPVMCIVALNDFQYSVDEQWFTRPAWENLTHNVQHIYGLYELEQHCQVVLHDKGHAFEQEQRDLAYAFLDEHLRPAQPPLPRRERAGVRVERHVHR